MSSVQGRCAKSAVCNLRLHITIARSSRQISMAETGSPRTVLYRWTVRAIGRTPSVGRSAVSIASLSNSSAGMCVSLQVSPSLALPFLAWPHVSAL